MGLGTVTTYLQRAAAAGLSWPLPEELDDAAPKTRFLSWLCAAVFLLGRRGVAKRDKMAKTSVNPTHLVVR